MEKVTLGSHGYLRCSLAFCAELGAAGYRGNPVRPGDLASAIVTRVRIEPNGEFRVNLQVFLDGIFGFWWVLAVPVGGADGEFSLDCLEIQQEAARQQAQNPAVTQIERRYMQERQIAVTRASTQFMDGRQRLRPEDSGHWSPSRNLWGVRDGTER